MKTGTIVLATVFAIATTASFAQTNNTAGGSSQAGGPAASKTTTGDSMNGGTTAGGGAAMKNGATGATTGEALGLRQRTRALRAPVRQALRRKRATPRLPAAL